MLHLYVGFDSKEQDAYDVCRESVLRHASIPVEVHPIILNQLISAGYYDREWVESGHQRVDVIDGLPFSTDFSFSRFLVPFIHQGDSSWAVFCDSDFFFRADIRELEELFDPVYAIQVVKHNYTPGEALKMSGLKQGTYEKKNWSSLVIWNTAHPSNENLTIEDVNKRPGRWLHQFSWLDESEIGGLPEEWNWLEGWSDIRMSPKVVHFTRGVPTHEGMTRIPYSGEWWELYNGIRRRDYGSGSSPPSVRGHRKENPDSW